MKTPRQNEFLSASGARVLITKTPGIAEYRVRTYAPNGRPHTAWDCFESDHESATGTARAQLAHAEKEIARALYASESPAGARPYGAMFRSSARDHARDALNGRTFYYSPDTVRFFSVRVLQVVEGLNGEYLAVKESREQTTEHGNAYRVTRWVLFDTFGDHTEGEPGAELAPLLAGRNFYAEKLEKLTTYADRLERDAAKIRAAVAHANTLKGETL